MKILLDTHIALWWFENSPRLTKAMLGYICDNDVYVSAASAWEVAIKRGSGKLKAPYNFVDLMERHRFMELPISIEHAFAVEQLPRIHADPFDRLLVAQATLEGMTLLTHDRRLVAYGPCVRVV